MGQSWARSLVLLCSVAFATRAGATAFTITLKNTTSYRWSTGLITLSPTIAIGKTPTSGPGYYVYGFGNSSCNVVSNDDGDATKLASSLGLTLNTNAWVVPSLNAGATTTVGINVPQGSSMSYVAAIYGSDTESDDDIILMHNPGDATSLSVPLFDGSGLPLANPAWEVSGYDLNSTSATNGNGNSCTPKCPVTGSSCWVAFDNGTTGGTLPGQPVAPGFTPFPPYTTSGYTTDGIALGDVTGDGTADLVVLMENGQYDATYNQSARGRAIVLSRALTSVASFDASTVGHDFMGFPTIENLSSASAFQLVAQEFSPLVTGAQASSGLVYARTVSGSSTNAYFTLSGFNYPGFWNMGSSTGDVRADVGSGVNELVVPSWNGEISVFSERTSSPATLNTYNFVTGFNEQIYGPVAIADVLNVKNDANVNPIEIIAFGSTTGRVVALDANTKNNQMTVVWKSMQTPGTYAFGSGPAIGDLDGDGKPEIVVAGAGSGAVYAYDPTRANGDCKYKWLNTGGFDYTWSSPVIADADGDGTKEVVVFSSDSVMSVLSRNTGTSTSCLNGTVEWKYTVGNGGPAWFTPALAKLTPGSSSYNVVVANYNTLEVLDLGNKRLGYRYVAPDAQFFPSAVVDTSGTVPSVYVSGWANGKIYRFDAPSGTTSGTTAWPGFMGGNTRTGFRQ